MADEQTTQVSEDVALETMTDEQLDAMAGNDAPAVESEVTEPETESGEQATPASGGEGAAVTEQPKTVEELQAELDAATKRADQAVQERDHWQKVRTDQEQNANAIRLAREELQKRIDANKAQDPAQLFIDNPQAMRDSFVEQAKMEMQQEQLAAQERSMQQQNAIYQNAMQIDRIAPDLKDNMDGIADMLKEYGDSPDRIQAFRNNPAMLPADKVMQINELYRSRKTIADLQAQNAQFKDAGTNQLQRVEQAAQRQPMTSAASGANQDVTASLPENMTAADIQGLSDEALKAALGLE